MLKVSDVMSRDVVTLDAGAIARDAALVLGSHGISGVPVVEQGHVVGVLSKTDLVRSHDPEARVRDIMTPLIRSVHPDDAIHTAVDRLLAGKVHRILVVASDGGLVGVVTPADVLRAERAHALRVGSIWPHAEPAHAIPEDGDF
jgi:predicted transcriptional regulator